MKQLKILDLFSGLGGFSLGLERTGRFKTVAFCEIDKYCTLLLQKHWKGVKIYEDVRKINKEQFDTDGIEYPDIITGGFPCQPFSVAGKQKGTGDDRHLWPEMFRIIKTFKPKFVIGENVKGLINIQDGVVFETVCTDLESEGYEVQAFNIPAAGVGAPHRRERIWILATLGNSELNGSSTTKITRSITETSNDNEERENATREFKGASESRDSQDVANTQEQIELGGRSGGTLWPSNWEFEPNVGRVANGIPGRVHRLKGLGNSIIPKIAEEIGKAIIGAYNGSR
jgi:DNA (cytosine-5)-methyltransferase 1